jgi:hypothetical protein
VALRPPAHGDILAPPPPLLGAVARPATLPERTLDLDIPIQAGSSEPLKPGALLPPRSWPMFPALRPLSFQPCPRVSSGAVSSPSVQDGLAKPRVPQGKERAECIGGTAGGDKFDARMRGDGERAVSPWHERQQPSPHSGREAPASVPPQSAYLGAEVPFGLVASVCPNQLL